MFLRSTRSPNLDKKSAPMMGLPTDATVNKKGYSLRRFRETLSTFSPNVRIGVPLAAVKVTSLVSFEEENNFLGSTEMSAPVSIKKFNFVKLSLMTKRLEETTPMSVAATLVSTLFLILTQFFRFYGIHTVEYICWPYHHNCNGTSNNCFVRFLTETENGPIDLHEIWNGLFYCYN